MENKKYTVFVGVAELDESGSIKEQMFVICMNRMCDYKAADDYVESAISFVEEGMAFNEEPYRPGLDPDVYGEDE